MGEREGVKEVANGSNFVYSPASIRAALSLAAIGGKGEMLGEMLCFLGSESAADLKADSARLVRVIRSSEGEPEGGPVLSFVNGIWVDRSMLVKPEFAKVAAEVYKAVTKSVDFRNQHDEVRKEVNDWVEKATNGIIKDLITTGSITPLHRVILCNALYFKGAWQNKFAKFQTRPQNFHLLDGTIIQAPFMTSMQDQFISSFSDFQVLRLPFRRAGDNSRSFSMHVFLPNDPKSSVTPLMQRLSQEPDFISQHTPKVEVRVGRFMLPKFKVSFGFEASEVLEDLGLKMPFSKYADFTGMASGLDGLCLGKVHHKASIEVDEDGAEVAAATEVGYFLGMCLECTPTRVNFVADHPFLFAVIEDQSGVVLFLGHVVNPLKVD
ncbi:hypothetical protein J5N97_024122 [Dioscorea zingiberensis]|uniref:Serpin domain-containing protein n=1 Tax=Dioscorea zingiberensis TaxID=325984 RepID=A0A9D5C6B3_9LILI|nr:hypothetical protein J5N97_024122 [Dioscorea zingiberensis]